MAELKGRHVLAITVGAFSIIIGVNLVLAVQAVRTFPGLEVANGYVASQSFDADRKAQEALGWTAVPDYRDGKLTLALTDAEGLPAQVRSLDLLVGRTTESRQDVTPAMTRVAILSSSSMKATGRMARPLRRAAANWLPAVPAP